MALPYSSHVRCARCGHLRAREICVDVGGLLYGPECADSVRRGSSAWRCGLCSGLYSEEDMEFSDICRFCAEAAS